MKSFILYTTLWLLPFTLFAQDGQTVYYSKKYLSLNIRSLEKYTDRMERQQKQLLKRLKRKERRLARKLKAKDSLAYARYNRQALSYDSISRLLKPDSAELAAATRRKSHKKTDSLKAVAASLQNKAGSLTPVSGYEGELNSLQDKLNYQKYINGLIDKHGRELKRLSGSGVSLPGLQGIEKEIFYGKARMKVWKQVADEPTKAEELALEYLQGTKGFSFDDDAPSGNSMQNATSAADLEKMGFQTRRQVSGQLQKQFGSGLENVQQKLSSSVADWQDKAQGIGREVKNVRTQVQSARADIRETKTVLRRLRKSPARPFKVNPMRGLPFWKRIEKGYSFNTSRATPDGTRPALVELGGTVAFKHTPRLSYGIGASATIGLGRDWSHIHFSFEGIGARSFARYEMVFGISAYAGYERFFRYTPENRPLSDNPLLYNEHNTAAYSEAVLLGLSKSYRINSKWNGAVQVLYDVWWREKGLNSPVILRFVTNTK